MTALTIQTMTDDQIAKVEAEIADRTALKILEDSGQEPTSRCLPDYLKTWAEYSGRAIVETSIGPVAVTLTYLFSAEELVSAIEDEGNLPWDNDHLTSTTIIEA
jgi:hypothetical protein